MFVVEYEDTSDARSKFIGPFDSESQAKEWIVNNNGTNYEHLEYDNCLLYDGRWFYIYEVHAPLAVVR